MTTTPAHALGLGGLLRLRVLAVVGILALVLVARYGLGLELPLGDLLGVLATWVVVTFATGMWLARQGEDVGPLPLTAAMALDAVLLTAVFALTGGPSNPFNFLYLVHIALASVVLPPRHAWALAGLATGLFALLFVWNVPMAGMSHMGHEGHAGHDMSLHLRGMWVAFALAAALILGVVSRVSTALSERERELVEARAQAARSARLASLATLAAGAAHELATPLGTISLVAKELERDLGDSAPNADAVADVKLIHDQVARCRAILEALRADAGDPAGEAREAITPAALVARAIDGLERASCVTVQGEASEAVVRTFPRSVALALRNLTKNAIEATPPDGVVRVTCTVRDRALTLAVQDDGPGIPADVLERVGEPFYTTRPAGRGMGLGVFLARTVAERLGGTLHLDSTARGTTAALTVPAE
jgi:two-component system sensor histidine kinase RegB